jgi:murein DD-endopeptidase MepM/ murein hydrolase activator NlpD
MPDLPQKNLYQELVSGAYAMGKTLPDARSALADKFPGVARTVQSAVQNVPRGTAGVGTPPRPAVGVGTAPAGSSLGVITTPYGGQTRYEGSHPGVDIANTEGTQIPAFTAGEVVEARTGQGWTPNTPSYGNYVVVKDEQGNLHRYSHLKDEFVPVGTRVQKGDILATMGGSGSTYSQYSKGPGTHLDYRVYDAAKKYLNPYTYIS